MGGLPTQLLIATRNRGKLAELQTLLRPLGVEVLSLNHVPAVPEVIEDGNTFEDNARKKARETCLATGLATVADDSGLCVDALAGAPGVYSARYAGPDASDADNNRKLLKALRDTPEAARGAHFMSVVALCVPDEAGQEIVTFTGSVSGRILSAARGAGGFGYDPLFVPTGEHRAMAELTPSEKHAISHRGRAMRHLLTHLQATHSP